MGDGQPDAKKRRISDLRASLPFCSQSALAAICKEIDKGGLPEKHSRHAIWEETNNFLEDSSMSMYGPLFQTAEATTVDNTKKQVLYLNFLSLLAGAFGKGGAFTDFLLHLHAKVPSSFTKPWRCVAYADEMHPGNMLNSSSRKAWCIYISFLELNRFLTKSDCWFCIAICRSAEICNLAAGMSQMFRLVLESIFADGLPETGVLLTSSKGSLRLHFTLSMILQDGGAQKSVWSNRQDTGSKPCFLCKNLFQLKDADTLEGGGGKVFSKFLKYDQLQIATDEEVISSWQRLASKFNNMPKKEFERWQQAVGMSYSPHALLSSEKLLTCNVLKPVSLYCFDYMHGLCSHGVLNDIIFLVLESIHNFGYKVWGNLAKWMELWSFPKAYRNSKIGKLFEDKNVANSRKAGTFKCEDASDILAVYKPLHFFLQVMYVANNVMVEQCTCFLSWAQVLDYLVSLPFLQSPSPARLLALVEAALAATVEAGFEDDMKPKQHWTLHYSDCFRRWLQLPACWALERKHKTPRKFGGTHCKLSTYEKGIMAATTMEHISILATNADLFNTDCHLVDPRTPSKKMENILKMHQCFVPGMECANSCLLQNGATCYTDDAVFLQKCYGGHNDFWRCGRAKHFFNAAGMVLCLVDVFHFNGTRAGTQASKWTSSSDSLQLIEVKDILQPVIHTQGTSGQITCLTPAPLSCLK